MTSPTLELPPEQLPGDAPKKRRRGLGWVIALVVVVVLVAVAWIVGDIVARDYAKGYVRDQLVSALDLPADTPMDIEIGPGSLIAQAIGGSIDSIDVDIPDAPLGQATGHLALSLTGIPLDRGAATDSLGVSLAIDEDDLGDIETYLGDTPIDSLELRDDAIAIGSTLTVFGAEVPLTLDLVPTVAEGEVILDPTTVTLNGADISLTDIRNGPVGPLLGDLLDPRPVCIASYLPAAITLDAVDVTDGAIVLEASGEDVVLAGTGLSEKGTCE